MISFKCNNCGRRLKIDDAFAGRKGSCPRCGVDLVVPTPPPPLGASAGISSSQSGNLSGSRSGSMPGKSGTLSAGAPAKRRKSAYVPLVRSGSGKLEFTEMIDMTAMVDIVFFLLIFFMVTSFGAKQASIEMPRPAPPTGATGKATARKTIEDFDNDADFIVVRIDADDTIWVEDSVAMTPVDLASKLKQIVRAGDGTRKLLVVGHSEATHGAAVMVMDAGHSVGLEDVRLAVKDED